MSAPVLSYEGPITRGVVEQAFALLRAQAAMLEVSRSASGDLVDMGDAVVARESYTPERLRAYAPLPGEVGHCGPVCLLISEGDICGARERYLRHFLTDMRGQHIYIETGPYAPRHVRNGILRITESQPGL